MSEKNIYKIMELLRVVIPVKESVAQHLRVISTEVSPPKVVRRSGEISNYIEIPRLRPSGSARNDKKDSCATRTKTGIYIILKFFCIMDSHFNGNDKFRLSVNGL